MLISCNCVSALCSVSWPGTEAVHAAMARELECLDILRPMAYATMFHKSDQQKLIAKEMFCTHSEPAKVQCIMFNIETVPDNCAYTHG